MMQRDLLPELESYLQISALLQPGDTIVVAVSGGPDSLALLHLLWRLAPGWRWRLHVAHLDHGLRGEEAQREAEALGQLADSWGLSYSSARHDVRAYAAAHGQGLQAAARAVRYAYLAEVALQQQAQALAVGHQADDQAETVLHHLIRGAGPEGLAGIRPRLSWPDWRRLGGAAERPDGPALVRPLLTLARSRIEAYCTAMGLRPTADPSNRSPRYTRNRIRQQLLPLLSRFNPRIVEALARTARLAAEQSADLQMLLEQRWPALASASPGAISFDPWAWSQLLPSLRRLALRRAAAQLCPERSLEAVHLDRALAAIASGQPRTDLPAGLRLIVSSQAITLLLQPAIP